jgi:hypothetical protein
VKTERRISRKRDLGGRPPKFNEPRRPITVTLPERTLRDLATLHDDRAHAIVQVTDSALRSNGRAMPSVEIVEVAPGTGVIIVGSIPSLDRIPWLKLIRIHPARYLISLASGTPIELLEVAILDVIDDLGPDEEKERADLTALLGQIRRRRRGQEISKAEILFVRTDRRRRHQ